MLATTTTPQPFARRSNVYRGACAACGVFVPRFRGVASQASDGDRWVLHCSACADATAPATAPATTTPATTTPATTTPATTTPATTTPATMPANDAHASAWPLALALLRHASTDPAVPVDHVAALHAIAAIVARDGGHTLAPLDTWIRDRAPRGIPVDDVLPGLAAVDARPLGPARAAATVAAASAPTAAPAVDARPLGPARAAATVAAASAPTAAATPAPKRRGGSTPKVDRWAALRAK